MGKLSRKEMKICIVGAGSTYSPEFVDGILRREGEMCVKELVLMDINAERLAAVGGLIRRICGTFAKPPKVTLTEDLQEAVIDADYVVTQFRVGMLPARAKDERIPLKFGIIGQETTGPGGFAKALRTIPKILDITSCMEKYAPNAMLINFTNPSGIITEAVMKYSSVPVVGLCNGPITISMRINEIMGWEKSDVFYDYFGLNHLGFIKGIYLKGSNVSDEVFEKILDHPKCDYMIGYKFNKKHVQAMKILPVGYLQYYFNEKEAFEKLNALPLTRAEQLIDVDAQLLVEYSDPNLKTKPPGLEQRGGAWYSEVAVALINSFQNDDGATHVINTKNNGTISDLPDDAVIEIPAIVRGDSIRTLELGRLPLEVCGIIQHVKAYESLTVKAGAEQSYNAALAALMSHPFMRSADDAEKILDEIIEAHPEYIKLT